MTPAQLTSGTEGRSEALRLPDLWRTFVRSRWLVLGVVCTALAVGIIYTVRQPRIYESSATILFKSSGSSRVSLISEIDPLPQAGDQLETEVAVLRSRKIVESVVDSLDLHVTATVVGEPALEPFERIRASTNVVPGVYSLRRQPDGRYTTSRVREEELVPLPIPPIAPGEAVEIAGVQLVMSAALASSAPAEIQLSVSDFRSAVDRLRGGLQVERLDPRSQIVAVSFRSSDPVTAAMIPNVVTNAFMDYQRRTSRIEGTSTTDFLREQVGAYERELLQAESRLQTFRENEQVVNLLAESEEQVARRVELQAQRDELISEIESIGKLIERAGRDQETGGADYRQLAAYPAFFSNRAVQDILVSLTELENQRGDLLIRRTTDNLDVRGLNQRISELKDQLYLMARSYLASLENKLTSVNSSLEHFGSELEQIPAREVQYARFARQQKLTEELYTLLQQRLKEAEIQNAVVAGDVSILDPALVPAAPISPKPLANMMFSGIFGLVLATGLVLTRYLFDPKIHSEAEALAAVHLPVLAVVPHMALNGTKSQGRIGNRRLLLAGNIRRKQTDITTRAPLITTVDPWNAASEAFRILRTNLGFTRLGAGTKVLMVTSALPGEGKSTTAANLGVALAQQGMRAVVVDGDLRRGDLHGIFGVSKRPGLSDLLNGDVSLAESLHPLHFEGRDIPLCVIPAGTGTTHPAELLGSPAMGSLLQQLRADFDVIIVDTPPLNLVADASALAKDVDATILVARLGFTDREALAQAFERLKGVHATIDGLVLNDVPADGRRFDKYYGPAADAQPAEGSGVVVSGVPGSAGAVGWEASRTL